MHSLRFRKVNLRLKKLPHPTGQIPLLFSGGGSSCFPNVFLLYDGTREPRCKHDVFPIDHSGDSPHHPLGHKVASPLSVEGCGLLRPAAAYFGEVRVEATAATSLLCAGPLLGAESRQPTQALPSVRERAPHVRTGRQKEQSDRERAPG